MRLRPELIGFLSPNQFGGERERVSAEAFKTACYAVARAVGGRMLEYRRPEVTPNFHLAHLTIKDDTWAVLANTVDPVVAFAAPIDVDAMSADFCDHGALAEAFARCSAFKPLTAAELDRSLTDADLADLDPGIVKEIRYWRADTLGKVLFNWFD